MSPSDPDIRPAAAADVPAIAALVDAAYGRYVDRLGRKPGPMLDDYPARVAAGEAWVAVVDGEVAGLAVVVAEPGGRVLLDNVAVHPRFGRRGLGRRLVTFAESVAARRGAPALDLYTHALMIENLALYGRLGYSETARVREHGFDRVYMRKELAGVAA